MAQQEDFIKWKVFAREVQIKKYHSDSIADRILRSLKLNIKPLIFWNFFSIAAVQAFFSAYFFGQ